MKYQQITSNQRYLIGDLRRLGHTVLQISLILGKHRSSVYREIQRNWHSSLGYAVRRACEKTQARKYRSRRHSHFTRRQWKAVIVQLKEGWAPEQISLRWKKEGKLRISHETIYTYIWKDQKQGGTLHSLLRQHRKQLRKGYRTADSRGFLRGKRHITERPMGAHNRSRKGHFEIDLVHGSLEKPCILTLVDRKTRLTVIAKLKNKTTREVNRALTPLVWKYGIETITADNGCEFHGYKEVEEKTCVKFYFATPYHSWERGTNENTNGLIRQYLPRKVSMQKLTQWACNAVAKRLNRRPRKILNLNTPEECHYDLV